MSKILVIQPFPARKKKHRDYADHLDAVGGGDGLVCGPIATLEFRFLLATLSPG